MASLALLQRMKGGGSARRSGSTSGSGRGRPLYELKHDLRRKLDDLRGGWEGDRVAVLDYGMTLSSVHAELVADTTVRVALRSEVDGNLIAVVPRDPDAHFASPAAVIHAVSRSQQLSAASPSRSPPGSPAHPPLPTQIVVYAVAQVCKGQTHTLDLHLAREHIGADTTGGDIDADTPAEATTTFLGEQLCVVLALTGVADGAEGDDDAASESMASTATASSHPPPSSAGRGKEGGGAGASGRGASTPVTTTESAAGGRHRQLPPVQHHEGDGAATARTAMCFNRVRKVPVALPESRLLSAEVRHFALRDAGEGYVYCTAYVHVLTGGGVNAVRVAAYASPACEGAALADGVVDVSAMMGATVKIPNLTPGLTNYLMVYDVDRRRRSTIVIAIDCPDESTPRREGRCRPRPDYTPKYVSDDHCQQRRGPPPSPSTFATTTPYETPREVGLVAAASDSSEGGPRRHGDADSAPPPSPTVSIAVSSRGGLGSAGFEFSLASTTTSLPPPSASTSTVVSVASMAAEYESADGTEFVAVPTSARSFRTEATCGAGSGRGFARQRSRPGSALGTTPPQARGGRPASAVVTRAASRSRSRNAGGGGATVTATQRPSPYRAATGPGALRSRRSKNSGGGWGSHGRASPALRRSQSPYGPDNGRGGEEDVWDGHAGIEGEDDTDDASRLSTASLGAAVNVDTAALSAAARGLLMEITFTPTLVRGLRKLFVEYAASTGRAIPNADAHRIHARAGISVGSYRQKDFLRFMDLYHSAVTIRNSAVHEVHPARLANPAAGFFVEPPKGKAKGTVPEPLKAEKVMSALMLLCGGTSPWELSWFGFLVLVVLDARHVASVLLPLRRVFDMRGRECEAEQANSAQVHGGVGDGGGACGSDWFFHTLLRLNHGRYPPLDSMWKLFRFYPGTLPAEVILALLPRREQLAVLGRSTDVCPEHRHRAHHKLVKKRVFLSLRLYGQTLLGIIRRYFILFLSFSFTKRTKRMNQVRKGWMLVAKTSTAVLRRYYARLKAHHAWCREYFDTVRKSKDLMWRTNEDLVYRYFRKFMGLVDVRRRRKIFSYKLGTMRIHNGRRVAELMTIQRVFYGRWRRYAEQRKCIEHLRVLMSMWTNRETLRRYFLAWWAYPRCGIAINRLGSKLLAEHDDRGLLRRYYCTLIAHTSRTRQRRRRAHAWYFYTCARETLTTDGAYAEELDESISREQEYAASMIQRKWRTRRWCGWHLINLRPINTQLMPLPRHPHYLVRKLQAFVGGGLFYPMEKKVVAKHQTKGMPMYVLGRIAKVWSVRAAGIGAARAAAQAKARDDTRRGMETMKILAKATPAKSAARKIQEWWAPMRKRREQEKLIHQTQLLQAVHEAHSRRLSAGVVNAERRASQLSFPSPVLQRRPDFVPPDATDEVTPPTESMQQMRRRERDMNVRAQLALHMAMHISP